MKHKKYIFHKLLLLVCFLTASFCVTRAQDKPIAIAHYICHRLDIPDDFLSYARRNGYEYVLGHAELTSTSHENDWNTDLNGKRNGIYNWSSGSNNLYINLKREFEKADKHGLKLIPCFNIGSRWAQHWEVTNENIAWNIVNEWYGYSHTWANSDIGGVSAIDFLTGDIDSDGRTDIVQLWDNNGRLGIEIYTSDGNGFSPTWATDDLGGVDALDFLTVDANGDGRTDVMQLWDNSGRLAMEVYTSDGNGYSHTWATNDIGGSGLIHFLTGDINGDGRTDIMQLWDNDGRLAMEVYTSDGNGYSPTWATNDIGGVAAIDFLTGDVNRDGRTDIVQLWDNSGRLAMEVYTSDGNGYSPTWATNDIGGVAAIDFFAGDVNGDGCTDILQLWDNGRLAIEVYASDGNGYSPTWATDDIGGVGAIDFLIGDANGDGRTDIMQLWDNSGRLAIEVYTSNGNGYSPTWATDDIGGVGAIDFLTGDVNRDGRTDIMQLWGNSGRLAMEVYTSNSHDLNWKIPPFASEPNGIDRSFNSYLSVVHKAFIDANLSYSDLEYIHLGHDETVTYSGELLIAASSFVDQDYIKNNGDDDVAYYKLMANEIIRRVNAVNAEFGSKTKSIIWADAWDRQHNGGESYYAWSNAGGNRSITIQSMKVTTRAELASIKEQLLLMPWAYRTKVYGHLYNTENAMQYFKDNGFQTIAGIAYESWHPDGLVEGRKIMREWVRASSLPEFVGNALGYCAMNWWEDETYWSETPRADMFLLIPELARHVGFYPLRTDIFQLWDNNGRLGIEVYTADENGYSPTWDNDDIGGVGAIDFLTGDVNRDDRTDIIQLWDNNGRLAIEVYTSDGNGYSPTWDNDDIGSVGAIDFLTGDVNGDGRTDIFQLWNNGRLAIEVYASDGNGYSPTWDNDDIGGVGAIAFLTGDVNGDGRTDIFQLWNNNGRLAIEVYTSDGNGYSPTWANDNIGGVDALDFLTGDVNRDGRTDIMQLWDNNGRLAIAVYTSDGIGYSPTWDIDDIGGAGAIDFLTGDVNGDGRTDIFQLWNNGRLVIEVYASDGNGYSPTWTTEDIGGVAAIDFLTGDVNGDGRTDILQLWDNNGRLAIEVYTSDGNGYSPTFANNNLGGAGVIEFLAGDMDANYSGFTFVREIPLNHTTSDFTLYNNYPNPFNPMTTIRFKLTKSSYISLKIYDLLGKEVTTLVSEQRPPGEHQINWDAKDHANGIYLCQLQMGKFIDTIKLILLK